MTDSSDLSSTEKLLDTIRGDAPPPIAREPVTPPPEPKGSTSLNTSIKHGLCAGVDISSTGVSLVLTGEQKQGGQKQVVKWEVVPFPEHLDHKSSRFPAFLGSVLSRFLGKNKNIPIWAAISIKDLKLRNLIIPDVGDAKIANAALWGLKKEVDFDPAEEIFDYELIGTTRVNGIKKKNVVAFTGDKARIQEIKNLFSTAGFPLTGISATPFAIQNFILTNQINTGSSPVVVVNVGRYRSEIFCMSENGIMVARSIKTGSYTLAENYIESGDAGNGSADVLKILAAKTAKDDPDFEPMEAAASRLLGKIQRTGEYCSNIYLSNEPIAKYLLFGETDNCQAFMDYARDLIPDRVNLFSPTQDNVAAMGVQLPHDAGERNGIIPALGLALAHNDHTPNFLYTYIERAVEAKTRKVNTGIIAAGLVGLVICAGIWAYFSQVEKTEIKKRTAIETQLAAFKTSVTQEVLNKKIAQAKRQVETVRQYADDYLSLAVMNEICTLTPESVSIVSLDAVLKEKISNGDKKSNKKKADDKEKKYHVKITGIVSAEFTSLESTLTGYVITLGDSPLFGDIDLEDKKVEQQGDSSTLKFTADMEIL